MFLSPDELLQLTGYMQPAYQRRWLADRAWKYEIARTGRPVVTHQYANDRMGYGQSNEQVKDVWMPNIAALGKQA